MRTIVVVVIAGSFHFGHSVTETHVTRLWRGHGEAPNPSSARATGLSRAEEKISGGGLNGRRNGSSDRQVQRQAVSMSEFSKLC